MKPDKLSIALEVLEQILTTSDIFILKTAVETQIRCRPRPVFGRCGAVETQPVGEWPRVGGGCLANNFQEPTAVLRFISYIHKEAAIAEALQTYLRGVYASQKVFFSSDHYYLLKSIAHQLERSFLLQRGQLTMTHG